MVLRLGSPGVYAERVARPVVARLRTDVAGFVGFEPRLTPKLTGAAAAGWRISVNITAFTVPLHGRQQTIAAAELELWSGSGAPVSATEQRVDTVVIARGPGAAAVVFAVPGVVVANPSGFLSPLPSARPDDATLRAAVMARLYPEAARARVVLVSVLTALLSSQRRALATRLFSGDPIARLQLEQGPAAGATWDPLVATLFPSITAVRVALSAALSAPTFAWLRLGEVSIRAVGGMPLPCVHPLLPPVGCTGTAEVDAAFGAVPDDGTQLLAMVRAFHANGGDRCHIVTVRRPLPDDAAQLALAIDEMIGVADASLETATGFARLALIDEVSLADLPDLHAVQRAAPETFTLPPSADQGCFIPCADFVPASSATLLGADDEPEPLFDAEDVWAAQARLIEAAVVRRARIEVVLTPPRTTDHASGRTLPPGLTDVADWQARCASLRAPGDQREVELSTAALYWPWLWSLDLAAGARGDADEPSASPTRHAENLKLTARPPTGAVLGVIARRDRARGSFVAPANEVVRGAVGLTATTDEDVFRRLYAAEPIPDIGGVGVNLLRAERGVGVQVWGSRTLSRDRWLRHLPVRRGLSALQRRLGRALEPYVFEPNTPFLWLQLSSVVVNELMVAFRSGGLRGATPEESFSVRCDQTINPPEEIAAGRVWIQVAVAIAAPAEFIVFRLGRGDGAVLVDEGAD